MKVVSSSATETLKPTKFSSFPPDHKYDELNAAASYFEYEASSEITLIQQLPDTLGTHALCMNHPNAPWHMKPVYGWRLYSDGSIEAMVADEQKPP
ncbi:hypothetical protein HAALTHF_44320n [Vreelandella aquamarina]|nr:hypothetical protein HAALTHF_44320n [Halomonas axialensis]